MEFSDISYETYNTITHIKTYPENHNNRKQKSKINTDNSSEKAQNTTFQLQYEKSEKNE